MDNPYPCLVLVIRYLPRNARTSQTQRASCHETDDQQLAPPPSPGLQPLGNPAQRKAIFRERIILFFQFTELVSTLKKRSSRQKKGPELGKGKPKSGALEIED